MDDIFISVGNIVVGEIDTTATFLVTLNQPSNQTVSVTYDDFEITADNYYSYKAISAATLNFAPGETSKTVTITIVEDNVIETLQTFGIYLSSPVNAKLGDSIGIATIVDNDNTNRTPNISVSNVIVDEKDGQDYFAITLDRASFDNVTVNYTTQNGSANSGNDYQAVNGSVTFIPGETAKMIPVTIFDDSQTENTENFNFILSNAVNATLAQSQAQGIIIANDSTITGEQPFISISDIVVGESDAIATFLITLNRPSNQTVTVTYDDFEITADNYYSYKAIGATTLNFAPGETSKTANITIVKDNVIEPLQTFGAYLSSPVNAKLGDYIGIATIIDDDNTNGTPNISVSNVLLDEKDGQAYFAITLDRASFDNVTVNYTTQDSSANSGSDYQAVNGSVTFIPGETAKMIPVTIFDDSQTENTENFNFILSNAVNATLAQSQAQGIIIANDSTITGEQPFISISDIVVGERDAIATFLITLNRPSNQTVTVTYDDFEITADDYYSYKAIGATTLNFVPGETSKTANITIVKDNVIETRQTFGLRLSSAVNAILSKDSAIATIVDNDTIGNPNISVADLTVSESDGLAFFAITLDKASTNNISVSYSTGDGSANSGSDYQALNGTVTFLPGETAKTIPVILVDNDQRESAETFTLNLSNATNGVITDSQGTANINDTDTGTGGGGNNGGGDTLLNTTLNRFRNKLVAGTYLFATEGESQSIIANFSNVFELEGAAFQVSSQAGDNLVKFNRFRNKLVSGTYLFATEGESQSIIANFSETFELEGTAFYAYGADAGLGTDYYRLANTQISGTYLFVNEVEKNSALEQFPNLFRNEGVAFEVG